MSNRIRKSSEPRTAIHAAAGAIRPQLEPVKEAVEAVSGIAETQMISIGLSAGGPLGADPRAAPGGQDEGVEVKATLTIRF